MASAEVTEKGILVRFDTDVVSVPGSPADQDDAAIEAQLTEALAPLGITPAQLDAVTNAEPWAEARPGELVQLFAWKPGVDESNWRSSALVLVERDAARATIAIVICASYGGFSVSEEVYERLVSRGMARATPDREFGFRERGSFFIDGVTRDDKRLVDTVRDLGDKANGRGAKLVVVEIPDGVEWEIEDYDGYENVAEKHRVWTAP